jgi:hypothetical protein
VIQNNSSSGDNGEDTKSKLSFPHSLNLKNSTEILEQLKAAKHGSHYLIVYPDIVTLREIYSSYIKTALDERNEFVIVLPYYETVDIVRKILSQEDGAIIDVRKYEKDGSLIIIDSLEGYFETPPGKGKSLFSFVMQKIEYAKSSGKSGVSVLADLGSFFYPTSRIEDDVVEYELSLPTEFKGMNLKAFCIYHEDDFNQRFTEDEREKLLKHHGKYLITCPLS